MIKYPIITIVSQCSSLPESASNTTAWGLRGQNQQWNLGGFMTLFLCMCADIGCGEGQKLPVWHNGTVCLPAGPAVCQRGQWLHCRPWLITDVTQLSTYQLTVYPNGLSQNNFHSIEKYDYFNFSWFCESHSVSLAWTPVVLYRVMCGSARLLYSQ